ncbi:MAG TPA: hypothetical protein VHB98_11840, partial [Chloroflexota bacterium]|nr:hypothetical protein [Chloroflexota bacterium]
MQQDEATQVTQQDEHESLVTLDQILTLQQVTQIALAPGGLTVAYVLREASQAEEQPRGQIYLVSADTPDAQPRRFTTGPGLDSTPRWSPDGRALAFLSDREQRGCAQLYVIALDGGEARRLTEQKGGVADVQWHPDGGTLAYLAVAAESETAEQRKKDRDDAVVASEVKGRRQLWLIGLDGTETRVLTPEDRHVTGYAWSPDGSHLAVLTTATPEWNEHFGAMRLGIYAANANHAMRDLGPAPLTEDIVWSRDGQTLFTRSGSIARFPRTFLRVWPLAGEGAVEGYPMLSDLPATPAWLGRARDADTLLLLAYHEAHTLLYRVSADGRQAELLPEARLDAGAVPSFALTYAPAVSPSADGRRIGLVHADGGTAGDLWLWEAGSDMRRLTEVNPWLRQKRLG